MIYVVAGPTCSYKNSIVFEISKKKDIHIINCDPFQTFREIPIITNQPTLEELKHTNTYLYGDRSIKDSRVLNVFTFQQEVRSLIDKLLVQKKHIFLVGGSGLYLNSIIKDYKFNFERKINTSNVSEDRYLKMFDNLKMNSLGQKLDFNNKKHNILLWEKTQKQCKVENNKDRDYYETQIFFCDVEKSFHKRMIVSRTSEMIKQGLIKEIKENSFDILNNNLSKIIGVKPCFDFIKKSITLAEMTKSNILKNNTTRKKTKNLI